jgi:hypothetical protein
LPKASLPHPDARQIKLSQSLHIKHVAQGRGAHQFVFVDEEIGVDVIIELDGPGAEGLRWVLSVPKVVERVTCWLRAVTTVPWNLPPKNPRQQKVTGAPQM